MFYAVRDKKEKKLRKIRVAKTRVFHDVIYTKVCVAKMLTREKIMGERNLNHIRFNISKEN